MLLGVVGAVLARNVQLGVTVQNAFFSEPRNLEPIYFGGLFALTTGWLPVTARDRKARFRFGPDLVDGIAGHDVDSILAIRALGRRLHRRADRRGRPAR